MVRGVRWYLVSAVLVGGLGMLAGCSGGSYFAEREPWRREAEAKCLGANAIREGAGVARVKAINGPGTCGADFPLRVSLLADGAVLGFGDELRPPSAIPSGPANMPQRWPIAEPRTVPNDQPQTYDPRAVTRGQALPPPHDSRTVPPPQRPASVAPGGYDNMPLPLDPPPGNAIAPYDFRKPFGNAQPPSREPNRELTREPARAQVPLGPARGLVAGAAASVSVSPAATLACPIVSALDQWIASSVQPAALRWFGQPVAEIRQISAYSCRGMNGDPRARISEHAFGNALDIASFTLADGRKITVKAGWHGLPEEQGFLRDVQGAACEQFTTVLAPGSNAFHYDHIHVDLMRRSGGRHACNPHAVVGEEVAARARAQYEARRVGEASITGAITARRTSAPLSQLRASSYSADRPHRNLPTAVPGNDGED
jgi:Extensin-like protein C-terminus